jgi:hypothetical protein
MTEEEIAEEIERINEEDKATSREATRFLRSLDAQQPPAVQSRPTKAYGRCKSFKKGCDRVLPACGRCAPRGHPCVYSRG